MSRDVVPHSLDAERAVLGAMLVSAAALHEGLSGLRAEHFFRDGHQAVFAAIAAASDRGPVDLLTTCEEMERAGSLDRAGGKAYVASLTDGVPSSANAGRYAEIVRQKAALRGLIAEAKALERAAYSEELPPGEIADQHGARVLSVLADTRRAPETAEQAAAAYMAALDDLPSQVVTTGYLDVDRLLNGGLRTGTLAIVAARPSVGKTTFALRAAQHAARDGRVGFVTLEMSAGQLAGRLLAWQAGESQSDLEAGRLEDDELAKVASALGELGDLPLVFDESASTLSQLVALCRSLKHGGGLRCLFLDYLGLLAPPAGRRRSVTDEVSEISRGLKRLAREERVAVVALSQLSRAPEGRKDKRPHLSDLRDSGALEQDTDVAILLYRPELHGRTADNDGVAEAIVAKNRLGGRTGTADMRFDKRLALFQDMAREEPIYP